MRCLDNVLYRVFLSEDSAFAGKYRHVAAEDCGVLYRTEYHLWEENMRYMFYSENRLDQENDPHAWVDEHGFRHAYRFAEPTLHEQHDGENGDSMVHLAASKSSSTESTSSSSGRRNADSVQEPINKQNDKGNDNTLNENPT